MFSTTAPTVPTCDVFLSFRGDHTRRNLISFLCKELDRRNIRTFKDDRELKSGQEILPQLIHAIKESKIAVVVVSANYAASPWCLKELVKIMDFKKRGSLTVLPIFFGVDPCHVRRQNGKVAVQFEKHEAREDHEEVFSWRQALTNLADISGVCSKDCKDDSELVDKITLHISEMLDRSTKQCVHQLDRSLAFKRRNDHFRLERSIYRLMNRPGINLFLTLKKLVDIIQLKETLNEILYSL